MIRESLENVRDVVNGKDGQEVARRMINVITSRALVSYDPVAECITHVERLRDAATDPVRRDWLHRLLGNLRKV